MLIYAYNQTRLQLFAARSEQLLWLRDSHYERDLAASLDRQEEN